MVPALLAARRGLFADRPQACTAYSRYLLDVGHAEDWFGLQVALTPCVIGYGAAARALHQEHATTRDDTHPYWKWVETYTNDEYAVVAQRTIGMSDEGASEREREARRADWPGHKTDKIEQHAALQSAARIEELVKIFKHAVKVRGGPRGVSAPDTPSLTTGTDGDCLLGHVPRRVRPCSWRQAAQRCKPLQPAGTRCRALHSAVFCCILLHRPMRRCHVMWRGG